jgi:hypothetical protein
LQLRSFVESKGFDVELKGGLMALNVKQQIINETNESKSIENISFTCKKILNKSCEFNLTSKNPVQQNNNNNEWGIPLKVGVKFNKNIENFNEYLMSSLIGLSMSPEEVNSFKSLGKKTFTILINNNLPIETDIEKLKSIGVKNPNLIQSNQLNYQITYLGEVKFESNNFEKIEKKFNQFINKNKEGDYKLQYLTKFNYIKLEFRSQETINSVIDLIYYTRHSVLNFEINNGLWYIFPLKLMTDFYLTKNTLFPIFNSQYNSIKRSLFSGFGRYQNDDYHYDKITRENIDIGQIKYFNENPIGRLNFKGEFVNNNIGYSFKYDLKIDLNDYVKSEKSVYEFSYIDILKLSDLEKVNKYSIRALD